MTKFLVIVDCQKDFNNTIETEQIISNLVKKLKSESANTRYLLTADVYRGALRDKNQNIDSRIINSLPPNPFIIIKNSFGSEELMECLNFFVEEGDEIEFVGLFTDICVISCVLMARTKFFNKKIIISCDSKCCAGTTQEKHQMALEIMKSCNITIK